MIKNLKRFISENLFVLLGILVGLCISSFLSNSLDTQCKNPPVPQWIRNDTVQEVTNGNKIQPKLNIPKKLIIPKNRNLYDLVTILLNWALKKNYLLAYLHLKKR